MTGFHTLVTSLFNLNYRLKTLKVTNRTLSHGEMIKLLVRENIPHFPAQPLFVETGSGVSTLGLAEAGQECNAKLYSCDHK